MERFCVIDGLGLVLPARPRGPRIGFGVHLFAMGPAFSMHGAVENPHMYIDVYFLYVCMFDACV